MLLKKKKILKNSKGNNHARSTKTITRVLKIKLVVQSHTTTVFLNLIIEIALILERASKNKEKLKHGNYQSCLGSQKIK